MLVAQFTQAAQALVGHDADAALALHRLNQNAGGLRPDRRLDGVVIGKRHLVEALHPGAEAFQVFILAAGGDRRQCAAVKGAFKGDQPEALRRAGRGVIAARRLDGAFHRLGAGIGEKHSIGKGRRDQPLG